MAYTTPEAVHGTFAAHLRNNGLSYTSQRRIVLDQILKGPAHFDIEELVYSLRRAKNAVSRATVYRTVAQLERAKLIRKMDFDESHAHFEVTSKENHHEHLVCQKCQKIVEFRDPKLEQRIRKIVEDNGMQMTKHFVQIIGLCKECRGK